jgi:Ion channel
MGYTRVRHYHGGLEDWQQFGGPTESALTSVADAEMAPPSPMEVTGPSPAGWTARIRLHGYQFADQVADFVDRQSTPRLFAAWLALALIFGAIYWIAGALHHSGLQENGRWVDGSLHGLWSGIYFSFVTVTSVGYGDVLPRGVARFAAVGEAVLGLLIFGAVVAKFVSRRQDQVVREIHRVTFEERIDRIQTNLHMLLSELQAIATMYDDGAASIERINARLESATLVFIAELRTVHYLLYRPVQAPDEPVLASILASLASSLQALGDCLRSRPKSSATSELFGQALSTLSGMASEICATCVPAVYAPALTLWMDRIHDVAEQLAQLSKD